MNNHEAASQWWTALSGWMADHRVRTDHLFLYDGDRGQLERCLDRNTALDRVDDATVDRLYRAAGQGRLGLLHPKGLQPLLLTTDPDRLFAPEKAIPETQDDPSEVRQEAERRKKAKEEQAAQELFTWTAGYTLMQEERKTQAELQEQLDRLTAERLAAEKRWWAQMAEMSRTLRELDMAGADEQQCGARIRDYLDGKPAPKREEAREESPEAEPIRFGPIWGNTLRHFCRFAASEVPLSVRHVQVARHCRKIAEQAAKQGVSLEDMGLDAQDQLVLRGTVEMGKLVERGLLAQEALTADRPLSGSQYRDALQSYLALKGIEETLIPHVQAHEKEISTGDGPVSALQILMANPGFQANDLRVKAGRTDVMAQLQKLDRQQVATMIRENGPQIAAMGQQVMLASCQMDPVPARKPEPVQAPQPPQKGAPMR